MLGRANANTQRPGTALAAFDRGLQLEPESPALRFERALALDALGRAEEAIAELDELSRGAQASPTLLVHLARALAGAGRAEQAEARVMAGLARWPVDAALHGLLAELRWSRGAGAALTEPLERAIEAHPGELRLRLVAADALRNADLPGRAIELLEQGLRQAPGSVAFLTSLGVLLDSIDRTAEALPYLLEAVARAPASVAARRNLVPALLRSARAHEALRICDELLAQLPDDQNLIAWRATSLRALGDPEYSRLNDYARLVRTCRLRTGHPGGIEGFNADLARELRALHARERRPLAQSLRGGSQTERNLPADNPVIAGFFAMLDETIRGYIHDLARLDPGHPTARRASSGGGYRFAGSWSVQLQPGGFHVNHVHPAGWLSSAYYVELPEDAGSRAGWLKFGEPGIAVPGLGPDYFVKPEPGLLALFPSYVWHGTVPFQGGGRRLTAAFDVLPA